MTVKKALIISTLAVILTGITACAVAYSKKTGNNPFKTMETSAIYEFSSYNYTNKTWTIEGQTIPKDNDQIYYTTIKGNYTITRTTSNLTINFQFNKVINLYNNYKYDYNINETTTHTYTNQEIPESLNSIYMYFYLERYYDSEDEHYYGHFYIDSKLIGETESHKETNFYVLEQTQYTENDWGIDLDNIEIANNIATLNNTYQTGWTNGNQGQQDVVDIRGLMLNILTMPFTFISQAFNITMWEGTPYQINLSRLILSLIAIASILFIIKLFTSGFSVIGNYTGNKTNSRIDRQNKRSQTRLNNAKADKIEKGK